MSENENQKIISGTFDWYLQHIMPIVEKHAIQSPYGYHGLYTHTAAVVFRGIDYALSVDENPNDVVLACAFHDMARTHDFTDMEHGTNAIPMACKVMDEIGGISEKSRRAIIYAVKNHSFNLMAPDYISACLWDADRTRLSWECGYRPECFSTNRAKAVAKDLAENYLEFMNDTLSEHALQIISVDECF